MHFIENKEKRKIRRLFREDAAQEYINSEKKQQAVRQLWEAYQLENEKAKRPADRKQNMTIMSCLEQLSMQVKYMDKRLYAVQVIVLFAVLFACALPDVAAAGDSSATAYAIIYDTFADAMISFACVSSAIFSTIAVVACGIADRHGMAELAGSCFFNHRQVCVLRMALSGMGGLVSMALLLCAVQPHMRRPVWQTGVYILVPYLVTGCVQFALAGISFSGRGQYALIAGGVLTAAAFAFVGVFQGVYEQAALGVWLFALAASAVVMPLELSVLFRKIERGDLLCMS